MATAADSGRLPWRKLGLTVVAVAAYLFFWVNGPLQEPQPVFEFEEHMTGFAEPVRMGEEEQTRVTGMLPAQEEHAYYHVMAARDEARRLFGVIGDARTNPGLSEETAKLVAAGARLASANPDGVALKAALDMYYAEVRDKAGALVGLYMENTGLNKDIKGYAGPIDIGVLVGLDGRIKSVRHLRSMETTSYLRDIEQDGFYERFQSIPLDGKSYEVDLVSGASLTTEGVARSVSKLVSVARESPLEIYVDTQAEGFDVKAVQPSTWVVYAALIAALFLVVGLRVVRRSARLSLAVCIVSILYLGFYLNNSFTYVTFMQPFMGVSWSYLLGVYATLVVVSAIWDGNSYCRYVCPYGNVQRLMLRIMPWKGRLILSNRVLDIIRWAIAVALMVGVAIGLRDWGSFELFPDLFGLEWLDSPWFWLSVAVVLISAYYPMLWCRVLCPTGAVLDGIAWIARPRRVRSADRELDRIPIRVEQTTA